MDIPLDDLMRFLTPLLPYLLRAGERAAEEAGRRLAGEALDLIDRIGLYVLREEVEKVLRALPA